MTTKQYLAALKHLGLTPASKRTAAVLGLSLRQLQRIAAGSQVVPPTVERLLRVLVKHNISVEEVE